MKKYLLIISILFGIKSFGQVTDVKYFGGIYEKQMYFNFVMYNRDTCYFVVEISKDGGREYQEVFCDSINPMPCPILHGVKIATNETTICVRVLVEFKGQTIYCQPEEFLAGKYTYVKAVTLSRGRPVRAVF